MEGISLSGTRTVKIPSAWNSLGEGYSEADLRAVLSGEHPHIPKKKRAPLAQQKDSLLIDIQRKMDEGKCNGYVNWAKKFNIKQMAQTVNYLREHGLMDYDVMKQKAADAAGRFNRLSDDQGSRKTNGG